MSMFDPKFEIIKGLQSLHGFSFQDIIEAIVSARHGDFQSVPRTPGDGGLDGLSHGKTIAYCCYGLDLTLVRTKAKQRSAVVEKFKEDLQKLTEVEMKKKVLTPYENQGLSGVLGKTKKLSQVNLVCNWFEDNSIIGTLEDAFSEYKAISQMRFLNSQCPLIFLGPKDLVRDYDFSGEIRLKIRNPDLAQILSKLQEEEIGIQHAVIDSISELEDKFNFIENRNPARKLAVSQLKDSTLDDWRKQIRLLAELEERQPNSAMSLRKISKEAAKHANRISLSENADPTQLMQEVLIELKKSIESRFKEFSPEYVSQVSDYILAALIGTCPLDWRK